jgi:hypothetical protein
MHHKDPRDWKMLDMCFSVNGGGMNCGSALIDTGIEHMYMRTHHGVETPNITIPNPRPDSSTRWVRRVKAGTRITVGFPTLGGSTVARFEFEVGDEKDKTPSYVVPDNEKSPPYINTGKHFLFEYDIAFDATRGRFGFRKVVEVTGPVESDSSSSSSSSGAFDARL